jgi:hypothetical protein
MKKAIVLTLALAGIVFFTFFAMPDLASLASGANGAYPPPHAYPVAGFELQPVQTLRVAMQDDTVNYPLYLKRIGAFRAAVSLSAQGVPTGTQVSLRPAQVVPSGYSTATLTPDTLALPGRFSFSVGG